MLRAPARCPTRAGSCSRQWCRLPIPEAVRQSRLQAWDARSNGRFDQSHSINDGRMSSEPVLAEATHELGEAVIEAVKRVAAEEIMPRYLKVAHQRKADGSLFTEADLAAQAALSERLQSIYPGPVMGEEMTREEQAELWLEGDEGLWCVDPIDGTSNFVNGLPYFAVSVALMKRGRSVLGVVYDPIAGEVFHAARGTGAWLN